MNVKTFAQFSNKTELNLETLQESCNALEASTHDKYILDKIKAINTLVNDILNYSPKIDDSEFDDSELISDEYDDEFIEDIEDIEEIEFDSDDELIDNIEDDYIEDLDDDYIEDNDSYDEFDFEDDDDEFIEDLEDEDDI